MSHDNETESQCIQGPLYASKGLALAIHKAITFANTCDVDKNPQAANPGWVSIKTEAFEGISLGQCFCFHPDGSRQPLTAKVMAADLTEDTMEIAFPIFELYGFLMWRLFDESNPPDANTGN